MKIPISTFKAISILWTLLLLFIISGFIYVIVAINDLRSLAQVTAAATIVSGLLTIVLFYINQFVFSTDLKTLSNVSFALSSISLAGVVYMCFALSLPNISFMIVNAALLGFHLLVFWKSNSYYNYREAKKSGKLSTLPKTEPSKPGARKTGREWIEEFLHPHDHDDNVIDSPDFLKLNKNDAGERDKG